MDEELEKSNIYSREVWDISSFPGLQPKGYPDLYFMLKGANILFYRILSFLFGEDFFKWHIPCYNFRVTGRKKIQNKE